MSQVFTSRISGGFSASLSVKNVALKFLVFNSTRVVDVDHFEEWVDVLPFDGNLKLCNQVGHLIDCEMSTLIQIEVIEDLLEEFWVAASQFEDTGLHFTEKMRDGLLGHCGVLLFWYLPCGLHHADKVFVGWCAHA